MAYLYQDDNEQQQNQQNPQQSGNGTPTQPSTAGGTGGASSASGVGGTASPIQNKPTNSGSFTNIQSYLNANQGSNLGSQIGSQVQNVADTANKDIQSGVNSFNSQAQAGSTPYDQQFVSGVLADPTAYLNGTSGVIPTPYTGQQQVAPPPQASQSTTPGATAVDPNVAAFQKQLNASYTGPQNLTNASQLQSETGNAQTLGNLGNTESGRFTLLNNFFGGGGQYNQGQQTLDNLVLQGSPNQMQGLNQARQVANQSVQNLTNAQAQAANTAAGYTNQAAQTAAQTQAALAGANTDFTNALNTNLTNAQNQQTTDWNAFQQGLPNLQFSAPVYQSLQKGLNLTPDTVLYNTNLANFVTEGNSPTLANTASAADYAKAAALAKLGGVTNTTLTDPTQAGQFAANGEFTYDQPGFTQQLAQNNAIYNSDPTRQAAIGAVNYAQQEQGLGKDYTDWINSVLQQGAGNASNIDAQQAADQIATKGTPTGLTANAALGQFLQGTQNWNNVDWGGTNPAGMNALPGTTYTPASNNGQTQASTGNTINGVDPRSTPQWQALAQAIQSGSPNEIEGILAMNGGAGVNQFMPSQTQVIPNQNGQYANSPAPTQANPAYQQWLSNPGTTQDILNQGNQFTGALSNTLQQNLLAKQAAEQAQEQKLGAFQKITQLLNPASTS